MIKRVSIRNFQKVKELDLDLSSVTAIVGESEKGKSCIARGIEAAISNAKGNKFITRGADKCVVTLETEKGSVKWTKKGTGSATYEVVTAEGREETYTKAEALPDLAREVLGLFPIQFGQDLAMVVNLQGQFEPPFLIFDSGTTVAKVLGKFTRLDEIYSAVRVANKDLHGIRQESQVRVKDLEAAEERLKKQAGVEMLPPLLSSLESKANEVKVSEDRVSGLEQGLLELRRVKGRIKVLDVGGVDELVGSWPDEQLRAKILKVREIEDSLRQVRLAVADRVRAASKVAGAEMVVVGAAKALADFKENNKMCPACTRPW